MQYSSGSTRVGYHSNWLLALNHSTVLLWVSGSLLPLDAHCRVAPVTYSSCCSLPLWVYVAPTYYLFMDCPNTHDCEHIVFTSHNNLHNRAQVAESDQHNQSKSLFTRVTVSLRTAAITSHRLTSTCSIKCSNWAFHFVMQEGQLSNIELPRPHRYWPSKLQLSTHSTGLE